MSKKKDKDLEAEQPSSLRRNKNNTSSSAAFSYHSLRSAQGGPFNRNTTVANQSVSQNKKIEHLTIKRWVTFIALVVILVLVISELFVSTDARLNIIQPSGYTYQERSISQYQKAVASAIGSSIYNRFKVTISPTDIANSIKKSFPEVSFVAVTVPLFGSKPTVYIQLTRPDVIYKTPNNSYILDNSGVIITNTSSFTPSELATLPIITSSLNGSFTTGDQLLSANNVNFIQTISLGLKAKGIGITKMVLVPGAEEMDVYIANQPYYVKFNLHQTDALQQLGTYLATVATLKQEGKTATQYIDVRVDGRAYYK